LARQRSLPSFKRFESIIYYTFLHTKTIFMRNGRMVKTLFQQHLLATKIPGTILGTIVVLPLDKLKM